MNDIIGKRFGRLTVLGRGEDTRHYGRVQRMYVCRCDCGTVFEVCRGSLLGAQTRSCGCLRSEIASKNGKMSAENRGFDPNDIIGMKVGRLTVVALDHTVRRKYQVQNYYYYRCSCECGGEKITGRDSLMRGRVASCGCLLKEYNERKKRNEQ